MIRSVHEALVEVVRARPGQLVAFADLDAWYEQARCRGVPVLLDDEEHTEQMAELERELRALAAQGRILERGPERAGDATLWRLVPEGRRPAPPDGGAGPEGSRGGPLGAAAW